MIWPLLQWVMLLFGVLFVGVGSLSLLSGRIVIAGLIILIGLILDHIALSLLIYGDPLEFLYRLLGKTV